MDKDEVEKILINGTEYDYLLFKDYMDSGIRHLTIVIVGEFKDNKNDLLIYHKNESISGKKILPHYQEMTNSTKFSVFVNGGI